MDSVLELQIVAVSVPLRARMRSENLNTFDETPDNRRDWSESKKNPSDAGQEKLDDRATRLTQIEVMNTETTEEDTKETCNDL